MRANWTELSKKNLYLGLAGLFKNDLYCDFLGHSHYQRVVNTGAGTLPHNEISR